MTEDEAWQELERHIKQMKEIPALLKARQQSSKYESMLITFQDVTVYLGRQKSSKDMARRCGEALDELREVLNRLGG